MTIQNVSIKCSRCLGTGIDDGNPCAGCSGTGYKVSSVLDITDLQADIDKILRRLKKIMDKLEITD